MKYHQRIFSDNEDLNAMRSLARSYPETHLHVTDLPWRLTSWALEKRENIGLWNDDSGQLAGWAVMQTPFWTIDYALRADCEADLQPIILDWVDERAKSTISTKFGHPAWFIMVFANQQACIKQLEFAGWASQEEVGENSWSKVWMKHTLPIPPAALPEGYAIQPLSGRVEECVELQQVIFESKNMTVPWRRRTLDHPAYLADCDLVVLSPEGRLAAFCAGWMDGKFGQIEPMGVHADFRHLGLGRAILSDCLRRLYTHGAVNIHVETDSYRNSALELYQWAGFQVEQHVLVFRKNFEPETE